MNDLGLTLAWLAVQVSLVLVPALALCALGARRSPSVGAWAASLSLSLVVTLNAAAFLPGIGSGRRVAENDRIADLPQPADAAASRAVGNDGPGRPNVGNWSFTNLRVAWARLERGAAEPAARCRPWGGALAIVALAGTGAGLLRLALGLGAVVACRRRGKPVVDPGMLGLLDELCGAIGCRAPVDLCEVPDLVGPATAGWRKPVILLPDDWRSWDEPDRRAVIAHELAHVVRGDYAAGLIARLAVALNAYHPVVHWIAGQLRLQQELAADAIGAQHAGGRAAYLVALSRLALRQDGRSPCWPARAFLPARGTLIRRISMLREETRIEMSDRSWSRARRISTAVLLLGVTAAVATLRGPARGSEDVAPAPKAATADAARSAPPLYFGDNWGAVIAFRPAAAARHAGLARILDPFLICKLVGLDISDLPKQLRVDTSRPGFLRLRAEDLEWITACQRCTRAKNPDGAEGHRFMVGRPAFRTVAPFDWLAFLRQWRLEFVEVRDGGRVYYRIEGPLKGALGPAPCAYMPDDRTIVFDEENVIRKLSGPDAPPLPAFLRGPDWDRACRGLLAVAVNNRDGAFAKSIDLGRPEQAVALSYFKGVDHWTFSVDDSDAIVLRAVAACAIGDASQAIARTTDALLKQYRDAVDHADPQERAAAAHDPASRMVTSMVTNLRVEHTDRSLGIHIGGFGTLADFAAIIEAEAKSNEPRGAAKGSKR